jgi:hypothetical protein
MRNKLPKIRELLKKARYEADLFNKYHKFTNLSQACEKTWVAFTLFLEMKSGEEINAMKRPRPLALKLGYGELYSICNQLHILHYEGSPDMEFDDIYGEIITAVDWIEGELK